MTLDRYTLDDLRELKFELSATDKHHLSLISHPSSAKTDLLCFRRTVTFPVRFEVGLCVHVILTIRASISEPYVGY